MNAQIAQYLNISEAQIIRVEEWATVLFVVIKGIGARFVSKRMIQPQIKVMQPVTWVLKAEIRRQEGKKWVARITGTDAKYGLARQFLSAASIEWGKYGMKKAEFAIDAPGYYQDSDGDYFKVFINAQGQFDAEICSAMEVKAHFGLVRA